MKIVVALVLLFAVSASADGGLKLRCRVVVPKEYMDTPWDPPPNGQPEPVRYTLDYEAFWWNCVAVRATDLEGRCKFQASDTPAAVAGAADGAMNAGAQIERLLRKYPAPKVQQYLRSLASRPETKEKMRPYFRQPTPEDLR